MKKITGRMAAIAASLALTASAVSFSVSALNRKKGDVTGDGKITQADAVWAARKADGQDIGDVSFDELAADVSTNGIACAKLRKKVVYESFFVTLQTVGETETLLLNY